MSRRKRTPGGVLGMAVIAVLILIGYWLYNSGKLPGFGPGQDTVAPLAPSDPVTGQTARFHFIDVGQGDAALIQTSEGFVLIDAGTNASEAQLKAYLDSVGVKRLRYAVFTHPHEDHIGGADMVLANYRVDTVLIPDAVTTTKTYERMMDGIDASGAELIIPEPDFTFKVGGVSFRVLAPVGTGYENLNNYSIVIRADFGETSVLFTGDAETASEQEMLTRYGSTGILDVDLLKLGHHGSSTSTSERFLNAVSPSMAVISLGADNSYGHPHAETVEKMNKYKITVWRTDKLGSVVVDSDGKTLTKK